MRRRIWDIIACLTASIVLPACNNPHAPQAAGPDPIGTGEPDYAKVAALEGLGRAVVVSKVIEDAGPPLHVTALLRNKADNKARSIQYRFIFLDEQGRREVADPDWHFRHMEPRTHLQVSANALDRDATDWRLEIRPAR